MDRKTIIDFGKEFSEIDENTKNISDKISKTKKDLDENTSSIAALENEINKLYEKMNLTNAPIQNPLPDKNPFDRGDEVQLNTEIDKFFIDEAKTYQEIDEAITEEIYKNPRALPELNGLDITIVGIAGLVATIIDLLIVKIPKDMNYLGRYQQNGSELTSWLKTLGIDEDGKLNGFLQYLENQAKVPFDKSINPGQINNFYPGNHRMLNLAHDPFFGIIFGLIDMLRGQMTVIDGKGVIHIVKTFDMPMGERVFAPFIWLAHIISDVCTRRGIPIPGWGFTQLLQFGSFGEKDRTVADLTRWMYESGYDLRHLATMAIVPASIEMIIRAYHGLSMEKPRLKDHNTLLADVELQKIQNDMKLHKMLFASHSIASAGNALKVFSMAGNPSAINVAQWGMLLRESIVMAKAITRDKTVEKIQRNRANIDKRWKVLEEYYKIEK